MHVGLFARDNNALEINPPPGGNQYFTENGSNWLWAVTAIFLLTFLAIVVLSHKAYLNERIFHYIFSIALLVGGIAYFAAASDLGWSVVATANNRGSSATYQVFWVKYVYWVVAFAAVIIALGLASGVAWASIFYVVFLAWIWIVSYLVSAFTATNYKWGFFAFGTVAYLLVAASTLGPWRAGAGRLGIGTHYLLAAAWANFLWLLYPIAFGLSDGGNRIGVTPHWIFFGILDVLLLPVLAVLFVVLSRRWDHGRLRLHFTQHGRVREATAYDKTSPAAGGVTA